MSIYRSQKGRRLILDLYDKTSDGLGLELEDCVINTRFGETHLLMTGPQGASPVVVLHGGNEYTPNTLRNLTSFSDHFRIFAIDTIGHPGKSVETRLPMDDYSYGEWLLDVFDELGISSANIFCGSYSASIAFRLAVVDSTRIDRLALVSPSGIVNGSTMTILRLLFIPWIIYRIKPSHKRLIRAIEPIISDPSEDLLEFLDACFKYVKIRIPTPRTITRTEMQSFKAPTMIFCQSEDILYPSEAMITRAKNLFQNLISIEILDGVHSPTKEQFTYIVDRVIDFFDST